jgi:hypothetical protein
MNIIDKKRGRKFGRITVAVALNGRRITALRRRTGTTRTPVFGDQFKTRPILCLRKGMTVIIG